MNARPPFVYALLFVGYAAALYWSRDITPAWFVVIFVVAAPLLSMLWHSPPPRRRRSDR